ncbi:hypothetical protein [Mucilaginibacter phyllosphaerae]|uniref:Uncharacterized protein n=1 Tax=Mucilaginibacter phyllosphaerae TaxID=1812349 RepID=A0A4Y8AKD5_9SPHI|nr:hypothetical protein [Mucilaginibacter phyllosphaerae]MBB3967856.1 hypothetical protein [Mucilaginibacter phyllosphaerae]TEW69102.1 hypothetical protein E2R65_02750 [Mucilaginibacter phyllosphaerae]
MKYLKILAIAVVALLGVEGAKAQVVVRAHIGTPAPRTVVVERPVERRVVVVNRRHYRPRYRHNAVVVRRAYYRPHRRHVVVRHY